MHIKTNGAAAAGASGLAVAAKLAERYGLIPPDAGVRYGAGETLTFAAQRLLTRHSLAREFDRSQISKDPFANRVVPWARSSSAFRREGLQTGASPSMAWSRARCRSRWRSSRASHVSSQITHLACEEGWSYIAEWRGVPLSHILDLAGALPQARYVVYRSFQPGLVG